jgi:hypothetical protein
MQGACKRENAIGRLESSRPETKLEYDGRSANVMALSC